MWGSKRGEVVVTSTAAQAPTVALRRSDFERLPGAEGPGSASAGAGILLCIPGHWTLPPITRVESDQQSRPTAPPPSLRLGLLCRPA